MSAHTGRARTRVNPAVIKAVETSGAVPPGT